MDDTVELAGGVHMPRVGLGVFRADAGDTTRNAVRWALEAGYRHIDTAAIYRNEEDVGVAVRDSSIPRSEVFITTKLWNADHGYEAALRALDASLTRLGTDYVDLYLIHWPVRGQHTESWRALEKLRADGKCRAIGVSNYTPRHLDELGAKANEPPAVNQFELHPFLAQRDTVVACKAKDIVVQAYCPVTRGKRLDDATVVSIAEQLGRTPAQVLLRWALQKGYVPLPKSENEARIRENFAVFDFTLNAEQLSQLDLLDEGFRLAWDPTEA